MEIITPYLTQLFADEDIFIPAEDGSKFISEARDVFSRYIDPDFGRWLNAPEEATPKTAVHVFEQGQDASFQDMFRSLKHPMKNLFLTQSQLICFCVNNVVYLRREGRSTFVPLRSEAMRYYIANIAIISGGLYIELFRYSSVTTKFLGSRKNRIIVRKP